MLQERKIKILEALIGEFVRTASPVSSGTLVNRYELGVSSATVRSILSHLESAGYLNQPHVSAGRVPTDLGYRVFVDDLLSREDQRGNRHRLLWEPVDDDEEAFITRISEDIANRTHSLVMVSKPQNLHINISRINLIALSPVHVVVIAISSTGRVVSRNIELPAIVESGALLAIEQNINLLIDGSEIQRADVELDRYMLTSNDELERKMCEAVRSTILDLSEGVLIKQGISTLFQQPELRDSNAAIPLLATLEAEKDILEELADFAHDGTVTVRIGSELVEEDLEDFSVVAQTYSVDNEVGVVALIGPKRMDYKLSIQAVSDGAHALKTHL